MFRRRAFPQSSCCVAISKMLLCKQAGCLWYLVYINWPEITKQRFAAVEKGNPMSKSATIAFAPSSSVFVRLFATSDRLLLVYAEMTIRNGDVPRCNV